MDLTPGPREDQERSDEPMYVILERQPLEPEKFRRKVLFVRPLSRADAEDLADNQRDIAKYCGRHDDTYEVYELCKPGDREAARRAGREDWARGVVGYLYVGPDGREMLLDPADVTIVRSENQQPRTPEGDVTP